MNDEDSVYEKLIQKKAELVARLEAINKDYRLGLDADSEERAQQLENAEVLEAIARSTADELERVEKQLEELGHK